MPDPLDPLFKALQKINEELDDHHNRLIRIEGQQPGGGSGDDPGSPRIPGAPIIWRQLEAAECADLWVEFTTWVIDLADRFELTADQLPREC
ncbi:hypothetical protein [Streptomyces sp. NPDC059994]|uniref:hypothetical protein n=1 Tax=Streptomyces sp. NPDC059994 TaxID=3347029 RepID=UPI0036AF5C37